jgi:cell division septation protein DedD
MSEQASREIQLTGKQLIFLFMSAIVLLVVVFLLGVSVGRGVRSETLAAGPGVGEPAPGDTSVPATAPASADDPVALSYPAELTGRGATPPAPPPPSPAGEVPPIRPPGAAGGTAGPVPATPPPTPPPQPPVQAPPPAPAAVTPAGGWFVQVGAFRSRAGADKVVSDLSARGHKAFVSPSGGLNRVRVGPFADKAAADTAAAQIERLGHPRPAVVKEGQ